MEWIEPPPPDMGAWDIAGIAAKKIGGRVLNGVVERHLGMDDVDVAGAVGLVSGAVIPMVKDAYSVHEGEPWYETWRFLGRKDEPDYHEEEEE